MGKGPRELPGSWRSLYLGQSGGYNNTHMHANVPNCTLMIRELWNTEIAYEEKNHYRIFHKSNIRDNDGGALYTI